MEGFTKYRILSTMGRNVDNLQRIRLMNVYMRVYTEGKQNQVH